MMKYNKNWWRFWKAESGIVGALIFGTICGFAILFILTMTHPAP